MDIIFLTGITAAILTTVSFLPQAIRVMRTGGTRDISPVMYTILTAGVFMWLVYGIMLHNLPIILSNSITLIFTGSILFLVIKNHLKIK